jgi:SAM-dependent methyltransferase
MDIIGDISQRRPRHIETLFPFFHRALLPEPSPKNDPDRFDVALADLLVNPTAPTNVLDLGCGQWLLLEKILQQHDGRCLQAPCSYLGIDLNSDPRAQRWKQLTDRCVTCFPNVEHLRFDLLQDEGLVSALEKRKPFDLVVLSFVLHELPPQRGLRLLELLLPCLAEDGRLAVIDPDFSWCFSPEAWSRREEWHFEDIAVEWEAEAVWHSTQGIECVLRAMGFDATAHFYQRSQGLWAAIARRNKHVGQARTADGMASLKQQLTTQIDAELKRIAVLRQNLCDLFRRSSGLNGEVLVKTVEFLSACASQCRRLEAREELGP